MKDISKIEKYIQKLPGPEGKFNVQRVKNRWKKDKQSKLTEKQLDEVLSKLNDDERGQ
jgi:hypothetical protein